MKSFPSSFTKDNLVQTSGLASTNLRTTAKNIAGALMNNLNGGEADPSVLGEDLKWESFDYNTSLDNINFTTNSELPKESSGSAPLLNYSAAQPIYENARKIPALQLAAINKYRKAFKVTAQQIGERGADGTNTFVEVYSQGAARSLFSPWFGVSVQGFTVNTPLMFSNGGLRASKEEIEKAAQDDVVQAKAAMKQSNEVDQQIKILEEQIKKIEEQKENVDKQLKEAQKPTKSDGDDDKKSKPTPVDVQSFTDAKANLDKEKAALEEQIQNLKNKETKSDEQIDAEAENIKTGSLNDYSSTDGSLASVSLEDSPDTYHGEKASLFVQINNYSSDVTDCSIRTLVNLSRGKDNFGNNIPLKESMGRATYKYADFLYCKDLG